MKNLARTITHEMTNTIFQPAHIPFLKRQLTDYTLLILFRPIVQVVGDTVALTTFREAIVDTLSVRQTMTVATLRNILVLVGMTGDTGNLTVLGGARLEHGICRIVAGGTELGGGIGTIGEQQRLVCLVAGPAVLLGHRLGVR